MTDGTLSPKQAEEFIRLVIGTPQGRSMPLAEGLGDAKGLFDIGRIPPLGFLKHLRRNGFRVIKQRRGGYAHHATCFVEAFVCILNAIELTRDELFNAVRVAAADIEFREAVYTVGILGRAEDTAAFVRATLANPGLCPNNATTAPEAVTPRRRKQGAR